MFHTYPEAERPFPSPLAPEGARAWDWVEFGLNLPYYLMEIALGSSSESVITHIATGNLEMVTQGFRHEPGQARLLSVSLISPSHVNGSVGYQLDRIAKIFSPNRNLSKKLLFVLEDSRVLRFCLNNEMDEEMYLLADFTQLAA